MSDKIENNYKPVIKLKSIILKLMTKMIKK